MNAYVVSIGTLRKAQKTGTLGFAINGYPMYLSTPSRTFKFSSNAVQVRVAFQDSSVRAWISSAPGAWTQVLDEALASDLTFDARRLSLASSSFASFANVRRCASADLPAAWPASPPFKRAAKPRKMRGL